jgi:hypothetical protein
MAGSFSLKFGGFSPITGSSYPHIQDKMTEIARNSPILRSDCLRKFRPFPINKDTALTCIKTGHRNKPANRIY